MVAKSRNLESTQTVICGTRYGNVMASRGSVIPLFIDQLEKGEPITVTDPKMTRFMMTLSDAVDLVIYAFNNANNGDIFVQKAPGAEVGVLARALSELMGKPKHPVKTIGTRHGEKLFEVLLSREEKASAEDLGRYYRIPPDLRDLNYEKFIDQGEEDITRSDEYTSHNTERLTTAQLKELLMSLELTAIRKSEQTLSKISKS